MLPDYSIQTCTYFAVDFTPDLANVGKVWAAAEALRSTLKSKSFGIAGGQVWIRDLSRKLLVTLNAQRLYFQGLGTDVWDNSISLMTDAARACLDQFGSQNMKRIGFKSTVFLPLKMSHAEMRALMFGSYLAPEAELEAAFGPVQDMGLQLHTEHQGMKVVLGVYLQTSEEAKNAFITTTPNLENFSENKLLDTIVKDFRDRLNQDSLLVDVDLSRLDAPSDAVTEFLSAAVAGAGRFTERAVNKLRGYTGD